MQINTIFLLLFYVLACETLKLMHVRLAKVPFSHFRSLNNDFGAVKTLIFVDVVMNSSEFMDINDQFIAKFMHHINYLFHKFCKYKKLYLKNTP